MPRYCCVPRCTQSGYKDVNGNKVSFHCVPEKEDLRKLWLIAIKRDTPFNVRTARVCSKHFGPDDFLQNIASGRRILRDNAVPSVFAFKKPMRRRKPPKTRPSAVVAPCSQTPAAVFQQQAASSAAQQNPVDGPSNGASAQNMGEGEGSEEEHALDRHDSDQDIIRLQTPAPPTAQETEIDELRQELKKAKATILCLEREVALLKEKCSKNESSTNRFCVEKFKDSDEDFLFYTGLPCYGLFHILLSYLGPASCDMNVEEEGESEQGATRGRPSSLSTENQLFLVLVRLQLGLFQQDLAHRFNVHQSTVSRLFTAWINFMFLRLSKLSIWPSRSVIDRTMPEGFKQKYPKTRVIIDATELKREVPSSFVLQSETFSPYKSANTFKGLVGNAPDGAVTFVSPLATGCISDKELVRKSGFLLLPFKDGDVVMADKGFTIADLLEPLNVHLNIPPFLRNGQFSEAEILETEAIASLRIHVERRIQRIKSFHIFDRRIPLTIAPVINQFWTVCVHLTNFQTPLIKEH